MSQSSSQVQDPHWTSIPLVKFSHNTSINGARSFTWDHINRNDLDLVIREVRVVDSLGNYQNRIFMKVTAGAEILESQDLGDILTLLRDFELSAETEPPVEVVVKSPFFAMKYPKSINMIRRIQIRFRDDLEFAKAVNIMKDLGFHILDRSASSAVAPPSISPDPSILSSSSVASSGTLANPISRSQSTVNVPTAISGTSSSFSSASFKSGFKVPLRPDSAIVESLKLMTNAPSSNSHLARPSSTSALNPSPSYKASSFHHTLAPTSSLYVSQIEGVVQNRQASQPIFEAPNSSNSNFSTEGTFCIPQVITPQASDHIETPPHILSASPFFMSEDHLNDLRPGLLNYRRPASASLENNDTQSYWIPPRRELPFPKSRSISKVASLGTTELVPLPKPTPVAKAVSITKELTDDMDSSKLGSKPAPKKRVAQRKAPVAKLPNKNLQINDPPAEAISGNINTNHAIQEDPQSSFISKSVAVVSKPSSASPGLILKTTGPAKKRPSAPSRPSSSSKRLKMVDQSTQTQTLSGRDHTAGQKSAAASEVSDHAYPGLPAPMEDYLGALDSSVTRLKVRPAPKELWETPGYVKADEEHRNAMVNNFICENLDNPEFRQLCQDLEFSWRKIGLGM